MQIAQIDDCINAEQEPNLKCIICRRTHPNPLRTDFCTVENRNMCLYCLKQERQPKEWIVEALDKLYDFKYLPLAGAPLALALAEEQKLKEPKHMKCELCNREFLTKSKYVHLKTKYHIRHSVLAQNAEDKPVLAQSAEDKVDDLNDVVFCNTCNLYHKKNKTAKKQHRRSKHHLLNLLKDYE